MCMHASQQALCALYVTFGMWKVHFSRFCQHMCIVHSHMHLACDLCCRCMLQNPCFCFRCCVVLQIDMAFQTGGTSDAPNKNDGSTAVVTVAFGGTNVGTVDVPSQEYTEGSVHAISAPSSTSQPWTQAQLSTLAVTTTMTFHAAGSAFGDDWDFTALLSLTYNDGFVSHMCYSDSVKAGGFGQPASKFYVTKVLAPSLGSGPWYANSEGPASFGCGCGFTCEG